jgi:ubiquinone/menaquinone biosynthesis C-methylase UbiE
MKETHTPIGMEIVKAEFRSSSVTSRVFKDYCGFFGYTEQNIKNLKILDVGAGCSTFAEDANEMGANVVRLDGIFLPEYGFVGKSKENVVRGFAQYLPFKDDVFDETISSYCLYHIRTSLGKVIQEMIRVTKPDGKIKIHPVNDMGFTYTLVNESAVSFLELEEAKTLVITKDQNFSLEYWQKLSNKLASSLAFRELDNY